MSLLNPLGLLSLVLVFGLGVAYWWLMRSRTAARSDLGTMGQLRDTNGRTLGARRHLPFVLFGLGLATMAVGAARPSVVLDVPDYAGTVILAFDVSSSMIAEDVEPNRMEAAVAAAREFVERQPPTIEIGVVAFGNGGLVVQEPTDVTEDVIAAFERLTPEGATSISEGIFGSLNAIGGTPIALEEGALDDPGSVDVGYFGSAVVVMLTDGEHNGAADPLAVAQVAANAGVKVYPVGLGGDEPAVIDLDGFLVVTQLDAALLTEVAGITGGEYFPAGSAEDLSDVYDEVDRQLSWEGEATELTGVFAGVSLLLLMAGALGSMRLFGRIP